MESNDEIAYMASRDGVTTQMGQSEAWTEMETTTTTPSRKATPTQTRSSISLSRPSPPPEKELPPPPPAKEPLKRPPPLQLDSRPSTSSSTRSAVQKAPQALSLRAPLAMSPPTRPASTRTVMSASTGTGQPGRLVGSNKRLSWSSVATTSRRPIKYGKGKFSHVELVPQPSDDPDDPLNWPQWRKELNLGALLVMVSMTGVMKTVFVSVNSRLAEQFMVSYTAIAALTGVPLMTSALTGFASLIAARIWGRRPLYLISLLSLFIGTVWNTSVGDSYGQCMAARVFQGLGWGAFDTLVMGSIHDTYFEHERCRRVAIYSIVSVATTWGPPLIGGVASQTSKGFSLQFTILSTLFVLAVPLIALGAPETTFDRAYNLAQTPATSMSYMKSLPLRPRKTFSLEACKDYLSKMKPHSYTGFIDTTILLQVPRSFVTPTVLLLLLASVLPAGALWGLTSSVSLLFSPLPFILGPSTLGLLLTAPFLLGTITVAAFALTPAWHVRFTPKLHVAALAAGTALVIVGLLTLGEHLAACMTPPSTDDPATMGTSVFALHYLGDRVNLPAVSFLLGLVAMGLAVLDATARPAIRRSTQFTSPHLGVNLRNTADMDAGTAVARTLFSGAMVIALPNVVSSWSGLRAMCVGVVIAQGVAAALAGAVWWVWGENVVRMDGRVLRLVDLGMKTTGSFFDVD